MQGKIVALEKLWNQAYRTGDTKALAEILDDSIVLINDHGSMHRKEFLASVKATNAQEQQVSPESMHAARARRRRCRHRAHAGQGCRGRKVLHPRVRFVDTWRHMGGGTWVCIATSATPVLH